MLTFPTNAGPSLPLACFCLSGQKCLASSCWIWNHGWKTPVFCLTEHSPETKYLRKTKVTSQSHPQELTEEVQCERVEQRTLTGKFQEINKKNMVSKDKYTAKKTFFRWETYTQKSLIFTKVKGLLAGQLMSCLETSLNWCSWCNGNWDKNGLLWEYPFHAKVERVTSFY